MPVIVTAESQIKTEWQQSIIKLYDSSPEFGQGVEAIDKVEQITRQDGLLYLGWFNSKPVAAIMASGLANSRLLHNIVVHPANRGRGIADRLVSEVCRLERERGSTQLVAGCTAIARLLRIDAARQHKAG
ncbi:GNAT family N-acetyltransferase [Agitococcus lubricus]|uniref:Acetyltransferase (GNAT) family protein n=1 Tax=Agitococcus lubricus TaxID=1077255 RepID=A0A2T5IY57_9GAMM|nr:GNAT family N-acetyltransferase [Agitococcus lubricus]PTQ88859.1 acetyltransferase (GNAT) family protein [Agitococcus lubricus]